MLIAICLADTLSTMILVALGLAVEANPIMAHCLSYGFGAFCFVKMSTAFVAVLSAELYRRHNPSFVRFAMRTCIVAYLALYVAGVITVNLL